jgi:hypothetical protein
MIALLFKKGRELADDGGGITERNQKKIKRGVCSTSAVLKRKVP